MNPLTALGHVLEPIIKLLPAPLKGREAAKLYFKQLGYKPGQQFYIKLDNNKPYRCLLREDYSFSITKLVAEKRPDYLPFSEDDPYIRDANGRKKWIDGKTYEDGFYKLKCWAGEPDYPSNQFTHEVFSIPNFQGTGITSEETLGTYSIFCESDDGSFEEQLAKIEYIAKTIGLIPSQIVYSGGKSLHIYYRLSDFLDDEPTRKRLQRKLITVFKSDVQIQNSNREMRFPGVLRQGKKQHQSLIYLSDNQYSVEEFETRLDSLGYCPEGLDDNRWSRYVKLRTQKADDATLLACLQEPILIIPPAPAPQGNSTPLSLPTRPVAASTTAAPSIPRTSLGLALPITLPTVIGGSAPPLELFLKESDRDLLYTGVGSGSRNSTAHQLACKLVARGERLKTLNIPYSGDPRAFLEQFCSRCSPALDKPEVETIWHSASRSTNSKLDDDYFLKKYSWWLRENNYDEWRILFKSQWQKKAEANKKPEGNETSKIKSLEDWKREQIEKQQKIWQESKTLTPTITIDEEYFGYWLAPQQMLLFGDRNSTPELRQKPPENIAFFGHSGLGTGKSTFQKSVIKSLEKERWFSLGNRNGLELQQCEAWDFIHLQQCKAFNQIGNPEANLALCVHSLMHFEGRMEVFDNSNIVLDEVVSIVKCLLKDPQLKNRQKILELFTEALQRCKRIFSYDANLADWVIAYIKELCPNKEIITVSNTKPCKRPSVEFLLGSLNEYEDFKSNDNSPILRALLNSPRFVLCCDNKKQVRFLAEILRNSGKTVLEICSDTNANPEVIAFLSNPNKWIQENWIDKGIDGCILLSPTAESGLDISVKKYFTDVYCLYFGIIDVDSAVQFTGRVRDPNANFHIWVKEFGQVNEPLPNSGFPHQLEREIKAYIQQAADSIWEGHTSPSTEIIKNFANELLEKSDDIHLKNQINLWVWDAYEKRNYRECFKEAIEKKGYELNICDNEKQDLEVKSQVKGIRDILYKRWSEGIFNARDLTEDEVKAIESKFFQSEDEKIAIRKYRLLERLPGIQDYGDWNPRLVEEFLFRNKTLIGETELYYLYKNPELAKLRSQERWARAMKFESLRHMDMLRDRYILVKALREIGLDWFLEQGRQWDNSTPEVLELAKLGRQKKIAAAIGKSPGKDALKYLNNLIGRLGLEVKMVSQGGKSRLRTYKIVHTPTTDNHRNLILECLERRLNPEKITENIGSHFRGTKIAPTPDWGSVPSRTLPPLISIEELGQKCAEDFEEGYEAIAFNQHLDTELSVALSDVHSEGVTVTVDDGMPLGLPSGEPKLYDVDESDLEPLIDTNLKVVEGGKPEALAQTRISEKEWQTRKEDYFIYIDEMLGQTPIPFDDIFLLATEAGIPKKDILDRIKTKEESSFPSQGMKAATTEYTGASEEEIIVVTLLREIGVGFWECVRDGAEYLYRSIRQLSPHLEST